MGGDFLHGLRSKQDNFNNIYEAQMGYLHTVLKCPSAGSREHTPKSANNVAKNA